MTTKLEPSQRSAVDTSFLSCIADDMRAVEAVLEEEIRSDVKAAYAISGHTLSAGGKRLRPALVVLSARAGLAEFPTRTVHASAAAAELIHMASLIHDDVVDGAEERRGRPTANVAFGNQISVLVGDYLLAKSIYLAAREGNVNVIRVFSAVTIGLSEGEVLQLTARGDSETTEETYLDIIEKKTAGFIAGCCEIGAMLAEAPIESISALKSYGRYCGLAFQIADDLLDYVGDPKETGKALDGDLREGKLTLPLILALRGVDVDRRTKLQQVIEDPGQITDADIKLVHEAIDMCDGYGRAASAAAEMAQSAKSALNGVPVSPYRDALVALADYAVNRRK